MRDREEGRGEGGSYTRSYGVFGRRSANNGIVGIKEDGLPLIRVGEIIGELLQARSCI